jgi:hypothetical protein
MKLILLLLVGSALIASIQINTTFAMFEASPVSDPACKQLYQSCNNGGQCIHHLGNPLNPLVCRKPGSRCYVVGYTWQLQNNQLQCLPTPTAPIK